MIYYMTYIIKFSSFSKNIFSFSKKGELNISCLTFLVLASTS